MTEAQILPQVNIPNNMIHLGLGQPSNSLLPIHEIKKAADKCLIQDNTFFLAYGEEQGNANFRDTLADFLTEQYTYPVKSEQLLITNGNSQALDFICSSFTRPGDTVIVEEPSYFLVLKLFSDHKLKVVGLPMDDHGLKTDTLEKQIEKLKPAFIYTIPAYHNPTSITLSLKRRKHLVSLCNAHNLLLVADEVYQCLNYHEVPPQSMGYWTDQCPLISLGSFSKILAPGLRLGWMQVNQDLIQKLIKTGLLTSGGGFNPFTSEIVNSTIRTGMLTKHIQMLKETYRHRINVFVKELKKYLPKEAVFHVPSGGYFIWVKLPDHVDAKCLRKAAKINGVDFLPGSYFSSDQGLKHYLRLSFAYYPAEKLKEGARRLGNVIFDYM